MGAIANNPASPQLSTSAESVQRLIQKDSSAAIRIMDLSEMRALSGVAKFFVIVAAPGCEKGATLPQASQNGFFPGSAPMFDFLEEFKTAASQAAADDSCNDAFVGDVKVNFATMEVSRRGEPLFLTALEFKTLKYLIANPRRVISRDELLNEVWGYQNYPTTRTVDNQVAKLRKKLEQNSARPVHLRTVRGVGYKFLP